MHAEVYGYRVNLVHVAIIVALYDVAHIINEFKERFLRFQNYENTEFGCLSDLFQYHCVAIYGELGVYSVDFIFTAFLIYGASSVRIILHAVK